MNGYVMYEVAKQRIAEQQRAARQASESREQRATVRGRRARKERAQEIVAPAIPDCAHEMFRAAARDAVPAPRREDTRGRHARSSQLTRHG